MTEKMKTFSPSVNTIKTNRKKQILLSDMSNDSTMHTLFSSVSVFKRKLKSHLFSIAYIA